jgi:hypothetical protein
MTGLPLKVNSLLFKHTPPSSLCLHLMSLRYSCGERAVYLRKKLVFPKKYRIYRADTPHYRIDHSKLRWRAYSLNLENLMRIHFKQ